MIFFIRACDRGKQIQRHHLIYHLVNQKNYLTYGGFVFIQADILNLG